MAGNSEEMELKDSAAPGSLQQSYDSLKELNANNGKHNNFLRSLRLQVKPKCDTASSKDKIICCQ